MQTSWKIIGILTAKKINMYIHLGKKYTLNELLSNNDIYSKMLDYIKFTIDNRIELQNTSLYFKDENIETFFNDYTDLISHILINPNNSNLINTKLELISYKFIGSNFLLELSFDIVNQIKNLSPFKIFEEPNEYESIKIINTLHKLKTENENLFYCTHNINQDVNLILIEKIKEVVYKGSNALGITAYFEDYLLRLKNNLFKPFARFESSENEESNLNLGFNVNQLTYIQDVNFSVPDKVVLFDKLMHLSDYEKISQRTKATILSVLLNENKETLKTYLGMIDKPISEANNAFINSISKVENFLRLHKIE